MSSAGRLRQFLHQARLSLGNAGSTTFVIGNESADLDSCISAIVYAALSQVRGSTGRRYVPVYNVDRADVILRKELAVLLPRAHLNADDLICRDELPFDLRGQRTTWALVDHNHFRVEGFSPSQCSIEAVIDHHVDEGLYQSAHPRVVQACGSCSTLVVAHFRELFGQKRSDELLDQLAALVAPVILTDTGRLEEKATQTDRDVVELLVRGSSGSDGPTTASTVSLEQVFKDIRSAKRDSSGLAFDELLRRDYKEWELGASVGGTWGISSVTTSLDNLMQLPDWQAKLRAHAESRSLAVHITMTKHGAKELMVYTAMSEAELGVSQFIRSATGILQLETISDQILPPRTVAYHQRNLLATRKEVAVICQEITKSIASTTDLQRKSAGSNDNALEYYPPFYFDRSKVYRSWVKLFVADVHRLKILRGFEDCGARFYNNHPVRWVQCVGICLAVSITPGRQSAMSLELDDGGGESINVIVQGQVASAVKCDFDAARCDIEVGTLFKVRGEVESDWRGEIRLLAHGAEVLADPLAELRAWQERIALRRKVLDAPWRLKQDGPIVQRSA